MMEAGLSFMWTETLALLERKVERNYAKDHVLSYVPLPLLGWRQEAIPHADGQRILTSSDYLNHIIGKVF
jgi:hypothetical protein